MSEGLAIDAQLVETLIAAQFPHLSHLPVEPVVPGGWDNRTFRVGQMYLARLPSHEAYALQVEKEQRWLPILAPHLPLQIPTPVALGKPSETFPLPWSIYRWIDGEPASETSVADMVALAGDLAGCLRALQRIDAKGGPLPGRHNFQRGASPAVYDAETQDALARLGARIDGGAARAIWQEAQASRWDREPVWLHGDVAPGNLLLREGRLSAVIDFGILGVGDPACDLTIAWTFFEGAARKAFRTGMGMDTATWARARGWALWKALITLADIGGANPAEIGRSRRVLDALSAEHAAA